jgi:hypothetical protein
VLAVALAKSSSFEFPLEFRERAQAVTLELANPASEISLIGTGLMK